MPPLVLGRKSDAVDEEEIKPIIAGKRKPPKEPPKEKVVDDDILGFIFPNSPKLSMAVLGAMVLFSSLIGLWAMGVFSTAQPPAGAGKVRAADNVAVPSHPKSKVAPAAAASPAPAPATLTPAPALRAATPSPPAPTAEPTEDHGESAPPSDQEGSSAEQPSVAAGEKEQGDSTESVFSGTEHTTEPAPSPSIEMKQPGAAAGDDDAAQNPSTEAPGAGGKPTATVETPEEPQNGKGESGQGSAMDSETPGGEAQNTQPPTPPATATEAPGGAEKSSGTLVKGDDEGTSVSGDSAESLPAADTDKLSSKNSTGEQPANDP